MDILQFPDFVRGTVKSSDTDPESSELTVRTLTLAATSILPGHSEPSTSEQVLTAKVTKRLQTRRTQIRVYQVELSDEHDVPCGIAMCKIAWDPCIPSLAQEVEIYQTRLQALQGTVVPRLYDLYIGRVLRWRARARPARRILRPVARFRLLPIWRSPVRACLTSTSHRRGVDDELLTTRPAGRIC